MRKIRIASAIVLGSVLATACSESPVGVDQTGGIDTNAGLLPSGDPNMAISTGEVFSFITIDTPAADNMSLGLGSTYQMLATLHYSAGGFLSSAPYASWRSSDSCVATVTNASPSWGLVNGVATGTAKIIVEAWGKADTVTVSVGGSSPPTAACYDKEWTWDYSDVSFTGTPLSSTLYGVAAGEKLKKVVLFAGPKPDYTISVGLKTVLKSELWYDKGGKISGRGYVTFSVSDGSVASVNANGAVLGLRAGRTKVIARLGSLADTVPLYVR